MSLTALADHMASKGRGPDSVLVHMAPSEVKSLQQLAMAHGGSLTINPQTGLPEAGFLSSLLPMLIGGGLSIVSGGTLTPLMASLMTGGGYAAATGNLKKGLMAGLGAYGGAGLGSALANAGAATAGDAAASGAFDSALSKQGLSAADAAMDFSNPLAEQAAAGARTAATSSNLNNLTAGFSGLGSEAGRNAFMTQIGGTKGLGMAGLAAAAPMLLETTTKQPDIKQDTSLGQRYKFNAGTQTPTPNPDVPGYDNQGRNFSKEQRYFNPSYMPIDDAAAKSMYGFASGGPVEAMSNANAIGMNTGYPQAAIDTGAYATPYQQPISRNVVTGSQGAGMNPYTGQAQFADGGITGSGNLDLNIPLNIGGGGSGGGSYGGGGSYPFANSGGAAQPSFTGQNNTAGGGYANPFGSSAGAGAPPSGPGMNLDPQGIFSDTFESKNVGVQNMPAAINQLFSLLGGKAQGGSQQQTQAQFAEGGEVDEYTYDPITQLYTKKGGQGATTVKPIKSISEVREGGGGGRELGATINNPGGVNTKDSLVNSILSSATMGSIANALGSKQDPTTVTVEDRGIPDTSATGAGFTDVGGLGAAAAADGAEGGYMARGGVATLNGGISHLGDYSDGGRLLRGPGDGISDSIPAMIGKKQPARLADGEFVVPARIVSELGNGSTEAGARKLYAMMDRVQKARGKTVGKGRVAANSRSAKYLPA